MATVFDATLRLRGSDETAQAFQSAAENARRLERTAADSNRRMTADVDSLGRAFRGLRRTAAIGGATALLGDAVKKATDYATSLNQIKISAGLTDKETQVLGQSLRKEAQRLNLALGEITKGYDAWRRASGQSAEEAMRSFPLIANAAKALRTDIATVATTAGTLQTNLKLSAEDMTKAYDMIADAAIKLPEEQRAAFLENMAAYSEEAKKIGLSGAEGLQQMLAIFNAIYAQTKNTEQAWKIFGKVMQTAADPKMLGDKWRGGLLKVMQDANKEGIGVVEVMRRMITTSQMSESALRKQWGDEIYDLIKGVEEGTIDVDEATQQLEGTNGRLAVILAQQLADQGEKLTRLRNSWDGLTTSVGGLALALDQKLGGVLDRQFGGAKTGSAMERFARDLESITDVLEEEGGFATWWQLQLDQAKADYERFAADIQKLFTWEGLSAAFENLRQSFNDFAASVGLDKWWAAQLEQMKKDAENFIEGIKKLFTWEGLKAVGKPIQEAFEAGAAKTAELYGAKPPAGGQYNPWTGQVTAAAGRQAGGPVGRGQPYIVGERGPELFVPNVAGRMVPDWSARAVTGVGAGMAAGVDAHLAEQAATVTRANTSAVGDATRQQRSLADVTQDLISWLRRLNEDQRARAEEERERARMEADIAAGRAAGPPAPPAVARQPLAGPRMMQAAPTRAPAGLAEGIKWAAEQLGISAHDLATAISFETAGTFDPTKRGPTTKWGTHRGLIQWGEPQAEKYLGGDFSIQSQMRGIVQYLRDTGVQQGHGLENIYAAINAGNAQRLQARDIAAGGTWGTVQEKVRYQMGAHREKAAALLGRPAPEAPAAPAAAQPRLEVAGYDENALEEARAARAELAKPIPITFEHQPGEARMRRRSIRREVDQEVREATWNSYADVNV